MSSIDSEHHIARIDDVKVVCTCSWEYAYPSCADSLSNVPKPRLEPEPWLRFTHETHLACLKQVAELRFHDETGLTE